jgi:long-chain acyl-CoA synthetase
MKEYIWNPWQMARADPHRLAVITASGACTFGELTAKADQFSRALAGLGLADGAIISTQIPTGPDFFALTLATMRSGYGLFPVAAQTGEPLRSILLGTGSAVLDIRTSPPAGPATVPYVLASDLLAGAPGGEVPIADRAGFLVILTSGTTNEPKVVRRARPRYGYRGVAVFDRYASGPGYGPHVMAKPGFHAGTLGPALYSLQAGSAIVVQEQWSPHEFAALVDEHEADSAFLSTDFFRDMVKAQVAPRRRPRIIIHDGSACPPPVKYAAIDLLGPVLHEYYGTSAGLISEITCAEWLRRPGSAGRPMRGVRVTIESGGKPVPCGEAGEICVSAREADRTEPDGKLRTGDVGRLDADGYLYVLGRMSTEGAAEAMLEHLILSLPGVEEAVVLPGGEAGAQCFVEAEERQFATLDEQIRKVAAQARTERVELYLRPPGSLPRTPIGKVRRYGLHGSGDRPAVPAAGQRR